MKRVISMMKFLMPLNKSLLLDQCLVRTIFLNEPHKATILIFDLEEMTNELYGVIFSFLTKQEIARTKTISHLNRKREFIIGRGLTRASLSWFCSLEIGSSQSQQNFPSPQEWDIHENKYGKPSITGSYSDEIRFNITHTDEYLAIAMTKGNEIGIDLEPIGALPLSPFPTHLFSKNELKRLETLESQEHCNEFAQLWTAKEAVVKCLGMGMNIDFSEIEIKRDKTGSIELFSKNLQLNNLYLHSISLKGDKQTHQLSIAYQIV